MNGSLLGMLEKLVRADLDHRRNERIKITLLTALAVALYASCVFLATSVMFKSILLFGATAAATPAAIWYLNYSTRVPSIVPTQFTVALVGGIATLVFCAYLFAISEQVLWETVAGIFALNAIYQTAFSSLTAWRGYRLVGALRDVFAGGVSEITMPPFVFVATSGAVSRRNLSKILSVITVTLFRTKVLTHALAPHEEAHTIRIGAGNQPTTGLSDFRREVSRYLGDSMRREFLPSKYRSTVLFLTDYDLAKYPVEFREWVASRANTCLAVPSLSVHVPQMLAAAAEATVQPEELDNLVNAVAEKGKLLNDEVRRYALSCSGPIVALQFLPHDVEFDRATEGALGNIVDRTMTFRHKALGKFNVGRLGDPLGGDIVTPFVDLLASTTIPLARSDNHLPATLRALISTLASSGFAPVADCYRRVRTAQSDVERFLSLLECYEVLVKASVITLQVAQWVEGRDPRPTFEAITRPSFGLWAGALRNLCGAEYSMSLPQELTRSWQEKPAAAARDVIRLVTQAGYTNHEQPTRTLLEWIDWLVWLRNATRGHGTVDQRLSEMLWQAVQETFLATVLQLKSLTLESEVRIGPSASQSRCVKGWLRAGRQDEDAPGNLADAKPSDVMLTRDGEVFPLFPFFAAVGTDVLIWNAASGKNIHYSTYSKGTPQKLSTDTLDTYALWSRVRVGGAPSHLALTEDEV